jgi:hypothetical protein
MIINDDIHLLFIEPKKEERSLEPINDQFTAMMEYYIRNSPKGIMTSIGFGENAYYRGMHTTDCGERSSSTNYYIEKLYITNSLAPFYLKWYRNSISENDWNKINILYNIWTKK